MYESGIRVFAAESASNDEVRLYGYGVYEGDFRPPVSPFGQQWEEVEEMIRKDYPDNADKMIENLQRLTNPRIKLDDGQTVWGCQCWWGPESKAAEFFDNRKVTIVPVQPLV